MKSVFKNHSYDERDCELKCCVYFCRDNAPGQRECDEALQQISQTINQLDQASLAAISQQLEPRPENSLQVIFLENLP